MIMLHLGLAIKGTRRGLAALLLLSALTTVPIAATEPQGAQAGTRCMTIAYDKNISTAIPVMKAFFKQLYGNVGHCVESVGLSSNRARQMLLDGEIDGEWARGKSFLDLNKNAVIGLPQPLLEMGIEIFWIPGSAFKGHPQDLKGLKAGFPAGFKWIKWNLQKNAATALPLPRDAPVVELLQRGRIDLFVTGSIHAMPVIQARRERGILLENQLWDKIPLYHLVHKRHTALVPRLNQALVDLIKSGEAARMIQVIGLQVAAISQESTQ